MPKAWLAVFFMCFVPMINVAQVNVLGKPGHIMTPSAKWQNSRQLGLNLSYIPQSSAINYFMRNYYDELIYGVRVGLTDFLEFNLNITYLPNRYRIGIGDRHADVRIRLMKEKKILPDLVLILSPPGSGSEYVAHNVLVATKSLKSDLLGTLDYTLGYSLPYVLGWYPKIGKKLNVVDKGFSFYSKQALNMRYLNGFFSAVTWKPKPWIGFMAEYDGVNIHGGLVFAYKEIGSIQVNSYEFKQFGGSFNLSFPLQFEMRELRRYGK